MYDFNPAPRHYDRVAVYLRKSRQDLELEQAGAEDTLARHRRILLDLARRMNLTVIRIYEEVVSGDTIEARPEMRKLLSAVEDGAYDAVVCHDIDRLGRGGMRDQGQILETFKWSHTAIITPDRTYDLDTDMDEEAMEYKAQGARFEYRMIKKRLARGREASVREGKFIGNTAPYGYERFKLQGRKGWSLRPVEPQAQTVRDIYRWFTAEGEDRIGVSLIVRRLNDRGIPGPTGKPWIPCTVRSILSNPVYAGMIRSKSRPAKKIMTAGELTVTRPRSKAPEVYPGLHDAIVEKSVFDRSAALLAVNKSRPGPKQMEMKNPLAGLVICDQCGRAMVRRPYRSGYPDGLLCPYTECGCVSSTLATVEDAILDGLKSWLTDFSLRYDPAADRKDVETERASIRSALAAAEADAALLRSQRLKAYDLVEQGVYTPEVFTERMKVIGSDLDRTAAQISALSAELSQLEESDAARRQLLPNVRHVLDAYGSAATPKEKNDLLRSVLSKVTYHKTRRSRWSGGSDLSLTLYPLIK